jgi:hypothetical protein
MFILFLINQMFSKVSLDNKVQNDHLDDEQSIYYKAIH